MEVGHGSNNPFILKEINMFQIVPLYFGLGHILWHALSNKIMKMMWV
jgi:hypothetical protein